MAVKRHVKRGARPAARRKPAWQQIRGASERRTAPARGTKARGALKKQTRAAAKPKLRFLKKDRVFHLVDPTAFVVTTDKKSGVEHRGPAKDARTTCCDKPIRKVFGIATRRDAFEIGDQPAWCAGVPL